MIELIKPSYSAVKSVNGKIGEVELTAEDIGLEGIATEEYVAAKIAEAQLAESDVDLSAYYTKSETDAAIDNELKPYALKSEIPSTTGLATEKYVDNAIENIDIPETDLTGYATEEYVAQKIAEAELAESDVDLSAYYTKSEVDSKIETIELTPGPAGPQGEKGDKGDTGAPGADGKDGAKGDKGDKGDTGAAGPQGPQGEPGKDGANGKDGAQGPQGEPGPEGPQGPAGADGKDYVLTAADKQEIADMVDVSAADVDLTNYYTKTEVDNKGYQTADQVTAAINSALGVIENGTY